MPNIFFQLTVTSASRSTQPSSNKLIAELIKKIRKTNNLTQVAFGQLFQPSVTQSTVARWERGEQTPDKIHFPKIASLLNLSFEEFLQLIEEPIFEFDNLDIENKTLTYNKRHLSMLKKGVGAWNRWREKNPYTIPQLSGIHLALDKYNHLEGYNLDNANLAGFHGTFVSFRGASLVGANLEKAEFQESDFKQANLTKASLKGMVAVDTNFDRVILREANLNGASIRCSTLREANLEKANLRNANLCQVDLSRAILSEANLSDSELFGIDFIEANLNKASLERTSISECSVYGASFLGTNLNEVEIKNVYISPEGEKGLPINNLALAQITYLHRYAPSLTQKFRQVCQLEEEAIKLASILADKYGNYSHTYGFHIFSNYQVANQSPPFVEARREGDYFHVIFYPDPSNISLVLSGKAKSRKILQINDGIIESNFESEDINILRELVQSNEKIQKEKVDKFIPIALKILELKKSDKFICESYILERTNEEIILLINSDNQIEIMRIRLSGDRWEIIRSSLDNQCITYFQQLLIDLIM